MKKLIFLLSFIAIPAMASGALVELKESSSALMPNPRSFDLKINAVGEATLTTTAYKLNYVTTHTVTTLSEETVAKLQKLIDAIPADAQLTDLQQGQPQCNDAPGFEISVFKEQKNVKISAQSACHEYEIKDSDAAKAITALMKSFMLVSY